MARHLPQRSYAAESGADYDRCWTPWHGVAPLLTYLPPASRIWEPACGDGWIVRWLEEAGHTVIATDIATGHDFLTMAPPATSYDLILTNVPFSLKYRFIERAYALGKPWAFLVPYTTLASKTARAIRDANGGRWERLYLDKRINFYMPGSGFHNAGAQMATLWLCHQLLPQDEIDAVVPEPRPEHRLIKPAKGARRPLTRGALAAFLGRHALGDGMSSELLALYDQLNAARLEQLTMDLVA